MTTHEIVDRPSWLRRRAQLLEREKAFMRAKDELARERRGLPDHFDVCLPHLSQRDAAFVAISRAPLPKLQAYAKRLGWKFEWVSSGETDFNYDFGVSFRVEDRAAGKAIYNYAPADSDESDSPGFSAFYKDPEGAIFHTYSTYGRGIELANATYQLLDLLPKGRDEDSLSFPMAWVRRHDEYPRGA